MKGRIPVVATLVATLVAAVFPVPLRGAELSPAELAQSLQKKYDGIPVPISADTNADVHFGRYLYARQRQQVGLNLQSNF